MSSRKKFSCGNVMPDYKVMAILILMFMSAMGYTIIKFVDAQQSESFPEIKITAPYNPPPRPHKDGEVIVGRESFTIRVYITFKCNASKVEIIGDAEGVCIEPPNTSESFTPREVAGNPDAEAYIISPDGKSDEIKEPKPTFTTYENRRAVLFVLPNISSGWVYDVRWRMSAPEELPKGADHIKIRLSILIKLYIPGETEPLPVGPYYKEIDVIKPPIIKYIVITLLVVAGFAILVLAGYLGFFRIFSTMDLVTIAIISAMQAIWVHIIGRLLVFQIVDRVPLAYNFAVADFPYILLLITAVILVRKPGTVSLTLFVYNLSSQIMGFYPFNPAWWSYPISEGLVPDLWILVRGDAILTDKIAFFRRNIPLEELETYPSNVIIKYLDGFIIGFFRGLTMQYLLLTVFIPYFYRISYSMGYVIYWLVIPWSIGNAIEGIISIPIAEEIKKSAATL